MGLSHNRGAHRDIEMAKLLDCEHALSFPDPRPAVTLPWISPAASRRCSVDSVLAAAPPPTSHPGGSSTQMAATWSGLHAWEEGKRIGGRK